MAMNAPARMPRANMRKKPSCDFATPIFSALAAMSFGTRASKVNVPLAMKYTSVDQEKLNLSSEPLTLFAVSTKTFRRRTSDPSGGAGTGRPVPATAGRPWRRLGNLFQLDRADLVLRDLGNRIQGGDGQFVDRRLIEVEWDEDHPNICYFANGRFGLNLASTGDHPDFVAVFDTHLGGVFPIDLNQTLRVALVQADRTAAHGTGVVLVEDPSGGEQERIVLVRKLRWSNPIDGVEQPLAPTESV